MPRFRSISLAFLYASFLALTLGLAACKSTGESTGDATNADARPSESASEPASEPASAPTTAPTDDEAQGSRLAAPPPEGLEVATFAGGCFWCLEPPFEKLEGVRSVVSGYAGGPERAPTYKEVAGGRTGHTESVRITYDPALITYEQLLDVFWRQIDPTQVDGQFVDRGRQYRSAIFVHDAEQRRLAEASKAALAASGRFDAPIVTEITDAGPFWVAEDYHQDFYRKNPLRYKTYRAGSGRDRFIEEHWGEEP